MAILLVAACVTLVAGFDPIWLHNDAAQYESTARSIRDHHEANTSIVFFGEQVLFGRTPAPQTVFPPGFPVLIAGVSKLAGLDLRTSGFVLNLACYLLTGYLIFDLCRKLGGHPLAAVCSSLTWLCLGIAVHCTLWGISEPAFMLFQVLALRLLVSRKTHWVLLAGCCAGVAISIRYAGIFLVMTAAMSYFVILVTRRDWDTVKEALTFAAPPTAMVFFLFRRSAQLVGTPLGGNNYPPQPVKQSAMLFISNGMKLFGIDRHRALNSDYAIPYIVAMAVFVVILMSRFLADSDRRAQVKSLLVGDPPARLLAMLYPFAYVGILFAVHVRKAAGVSDRLLLPFVPFLGISIALLASHVSLPLRSRWAVRTGMSVLLTLFLVGQLNAWRHHLDETEYPARAMQSALTAKIDGQQSVVDYLQDNVTNDRPLLCNQPQLTSALLDVPVIGLATGRYNTEGEWTAERVETEIIDRFQVGLVLRYRNRAVVHQGMPGVFWVMEDHLKQRLKCIFQTDEISLCEVLPKSQSTGSR